MIILSLVIICKVKNLKVPIKDSCMYNESDITKFQRTETS